MNVTSNDNLVDESQNLTSGNDLDALNEEGASETTKTAYFNVSDDTTYLNSSDFQVQLVDENGTGISNKSILFRINLVNTNVTTDGNGIAKLSLKDVPKGTYNLYYNFIQDGYNTLKAHKQVLILSNGDSKITAANYIAYRGVSNPFTVTLTVDGIPLANRNVTFKISGRTYVRTTDAQGKAILYINTRVGTYNIEYSFAGEQGIKKSSGKAVIYVRQGMPVKMYKANSIIYQRGVSAPFKVKLVDIRGNPLANKYVTFNLNKKNYKVKTNSLGIAYINIKLAKGNYKLKATFAKNSVYNGVSQTYAVVVKSNIKNGGIWLFAYDMKQVNFKSLQSYGINHIFLNYYAIHEYGQSYVEKYIQSASNYGLKVHIWMQVFYYGSWINPVKNGKINYDLIKSKVNVAVKYAKVKGVAGIHFDYLRYPGNAYKYKNSVNAINYFTKLACTQIHKVNSRLIVSAAVMPEPSGMKYYYGQDIPTLSKYLDVIIPMVYKGNYNSGTAWIKSVTNTFVKQSNGAQIWTGLQSYRSDSDVTRLSSNELMKDSIAAINGGATGIVFFRHGLTNYFKLSTL